MKYKYRGEVDNEPNLFLRKCRNTLGYGVGWTFWGALIEWITPKLLFLALISVWLYLYIHLEIDLDFIWR